MCPSFVVLRARENNSEPALLRSIKIARIFTGSCTLSARVWELAVQPPLQPRSSTLYTDWEWLGHLWMVESSYNNPCPTGSPAGRENIWEHRRDALLVSIGTGKCAGQTVSEVSQRNPIVERMKKRLSRETERTANDFYRNHSRMVRDLLFLLMVHMVLEAYRPGRGITKCLLYGGRDPSLLRCHSRNGQEVGCMHWGLQRPLQKVTRSTPFKVGRCSVNATSDRHLFEGCFAAIYLETMPNCVAGLGWYKADRS